MADQSNPVRISVVDSTRMGCQLLAEALSRDPLLRVVHSCATARDVVRGITENRPDVLLLSDTLDDRPMLGLDVARQLRSSLPRLGIVALLDTPKRELVLSAFSAGVRGVFCRDESIEALAKCIRCVHSGQVWASSVELGHLLQAFADSSPQPLVNSKGAALLTQREQEVVRCVTEGLTNREIAARLHLSQHTIKNYIFRIFDKLGVSTRVEMVLYAFTRQSAIDLTGPAEPASGADDELERHSKAARHGAAGAFLALGDLAIRNGNAPADLVRACMWFRLAHEAAAKLDAISRRRLDEVQDQLSPAELQAAERYAAEWVGENQGCEYVSALTHPRIAVSHASGTSSKRPGSRQRPGGSEDERKSHLVLVQPNHSYDAAPDHAMTLEADGTLQRKAD